jgi:hypothetical protein
MAGSSPEALGMTLDLETLVLRSGVHRSPPDGVSLMEAVSAVAGELWSNSPSCTSPVISVYAQSLADWLPDIERQTLKPYIPRLVGTARPDLELARALICADVAVRVFARLALEAAGLGQEAKRLGALGPIDRESADSARLASSAAELAARSAASTSEWSMTESMRLAAESARSAALSVSSAGRSAVSASASASAAESTARLAVRSAVSAEEAARQAGKSAEPVRSAAFGLLDRLIAAGS